MRGNLNIALAALAFVVTVPCAAKSPPASGTEAKPVAATQASERSAEARIFDLPYLQRELPNGLRVIVVRTPQKGVVSLQIPMQTGSRNEVEAGKTGFAHFFEHMMFRGTEQNPPEKYEALTKAAGADHNAYTTNDYTNYYMNFTPADLEQMIALEADRFQHLKYSEEQFRTEALAVKGEYLKNFANPVVKADERLSDLAYTTHTYKHTTMGFFADIENMPNQIDYAHQFFERWYRPQNASVIVAGDIDPEATLKLVEKYWSGWERGDYSVDVPAEPPQQKAKYEHLKWDAPTVPYLLIGWHAPGFAADKIELPALTLLGEIYFGETSPLYQKLVVKEQLVDEFGYEAPRERDPGLFQLLARVTKPENTQKVVEAIQDTLLKARTELVDPAQLAQVKAHLKYRFARSMASASTIGATLAAFVRYDRDVETLNRYYRSFDKVAPNDLVDIANRVFNDGNRTTISVANSDQLAGADSFRALDDQVKQAGTKAAQAASAKETQPARKSADEIFAERDRAKIEQGTKGWAASEARTWVLPIEQRSESPLVDVSLLFKIGAAYDPPGKKGLAQLTASMITEGGSKTRSIEEIRKALYPFAAELDDQVDKDVTRLHGLVHRDNAAAWWSVVSEQITNPGFSEADFTRLKQQQLNAIKVGLRSNNDEEFGKEALYEQIYGPKHAYGTLTLGHVKDVESLTLKDVKDFYLKWYRRGRITLGLAGGYGDDFSEIVFATLGRLGKDDSHFEPGAPKAEAAKQRRALVIQKETPSVAVSFGFPLDLRRGDPDWPALWLARAWLGEHRASSGQLYQRIRELRGMNYGDYAYIEYFPNGSRLMQPEPNYARRNDIFQVWLRPLRNNNDAMFATRAALFELQRMSSEGLTRQEFESTREYLKKYVAVLTAHQSKQLGYALDSNYYGTAPFVEYVRDALDNLSLDEVNNALKHHLKLDGLQFVFIGKDAEGLAAKLAADAPSPITYNAPKPAAVTTQDKVIAKLPLKLPKAQVQVVKDTDMFE